MQKQVSAIHKWQILPFSRADQQQHLDQSEMLLTSVSPGDQGTLYWSMASPVGLVLGYAQKPHILNQETLVTHPIPIYHRRAGGTAVLVGPHLLSLDVVLPAGHPLILSDVVESYHWLGETWIEALSLLGVQARLVSPEEAHAQRNLLKQPETREHEAILHRACYGTLSPYEVVVDQRKIVGLDMIRRRVGTLLQAGILLHWETEILAQLLGHTPEEQYILRKELRERAIGIDDLVRRVITPEEIIHAFEQALFQR